MGRAVGAGGLSLEAQLLVLGGNVIPEQLQGLAHGALSICSKVPGKFALQDLDDGVRDKLQEGDKRL